MDGVYAAIYQRAREIMTDEFVSGRVALANDSVFGTRLFIACALVIWAAFAIAYFVVRKRCKDSDVVDWMGFVFLIANIVGAVALLLSLIMLSDFTQSAIAWQTDPLTQTVDYIITELYV